MNRIEITGGLTRDPELVYLPNSGAALMEMTVAVNVARYNGETRQQEVTTIYVLVKAWSSLAEAIAEDDLSKGDEVYVLGELEQRTVEKRDKSKESKTHVTAKMVSVVRRRGGASAPARRPAPAADVPPPPAEPPGGWADDEEPF